MERLRSATAVVSVLLAAVSCGSSDGVRDSGGLDLAILDAAGDTPGGAGAWDVQDSEDVSQDQAGSGSQDTQDADAQADQGADIDPFERSPELYVRILGPSSTGYASSAGSIVALTGVLFGKADSMSWTGPAGSGGIEPQGFWLTGAVELQPGDNEITVTASSGDGKAAKDTITVTYLPGFAFSGETRARPDVVFVGEDIEVVFSVGLGQAPTGGDVKLHELAPDGSAGDAVGVMKDDGEVWSSGDEIADDGVYSLRLDMECSQAGLVGFRVGVPVKTGITSYTAYTPPVFVECVERLAKTDCQVAVDAISAARQVYFDQEPGGPEDARKAALEYLEGLPHVVEAGLETGGYGLWARFESGLLGAVSLAPQGLRAASGTIGSGLVETYSEIASKETHLLSPYTTEFGETDETYGITQKLKDKGCPTYSVNGPFLGTASTVERWRKALSGGVVSMVTHGDTFFKGMNQDAKAAFGWKHMGSQEALATGEPINCSQMLSTTKTCYGPGTCPAGTKCVVTSASGTSLSGVCVDRTQADLRRGRLAIGAGTYVMLPSFVEHYGKGQMPNSLVYLGACRTAYNGTLAAAFLGAGAKAVAGYDGYVTSKFAGQAGDDFFTALVAAEENVGDSIPADAEDPDTGSRFVVFGAKDLSITSSHIVNQGFERGDLTGWNADGDGRVITRLGATGPVSGKFMGIISTGLGYTVETGSIEQTFCIPPGTFGFTFYWKFYSEEFHEWCGSQFQDTFTAKFVTDTGLEVPMVDVSVDDLCDPDDCYECCVDDVCVGLVDSDVDFDQGDTWVVPRWQRAKVDVSGIAGTGPVTLVFFCTDKGDSIYDTVVLLDSLKFK